MGAISVAFLILILPAFSHGAEASDSYLDENGILQRIPADAIELEGGKTLSMTDGNWYFVNKDIEYAGAATAIGSVKLIIADGCTVTVSDLSVSADSSLTIYPQENRTGILTSTSNAGCSTCQFTNNGTHCIFIVGGADITNINGASFAAYGSSATAPAAAGAAAFNECHSVNMETPAAYAASVTSFTGVDTPMYLNIYFTDNGHLNNGSFCGADL